MVAREQEQPSLQYQCTVLPEWIDYNGHMSEAYYVLAFGFATDQVMESFGMGPRYRRETGNSLYTVEAHVRYLLETGEGAKLSMTTTVAGAGSKKLHLAHEMHTDGKLIATEELLALHVNSRTGRSHPFPERVADMIGRYRLPGQLEPPDWVGRAVSI